MLKNKLVDDCIANSPKEIQAKLQDLRKFIIAKIPNVEETISYGVPAYKLNGKAVIYFSGYKNHISIYPAPRGKKEFKEELSKYKGGKGTIQFQNSEPIPYDLVEKIINFLVKR
jgi:uncharacterized protein YdhG (YjbR/CyaY superfamily)